MTIQCFYCSGEPSKVLTGGCVHEHIKTRDLCASCANWAVSSDPVCRECRVDHDHDCAILFAEVVV